MSEAIGLFLLGFQWAGIAFGIFLLALVGGTIAYSGAKLMLGRGGRR